MLVSTQAVLGWIGLPHTSNSIPAGSFCHSATYGPRMIFLSLLTARTVPPRKTGGLLGVISDNDQHNLRCSCTGVPLNESRTFLGSRRHWTLRKENHGKHPT